jgi:hypothetical protein
MAFLAAVRDFAGFGTATTVHDADGIPYFGNEFWTAGQRQAHSLHEVSYRACFKPQLPGFFISQLTAPGEVVHDPFMGRGTTPLQAALMGRVASGSDINPLATMLTRPRLTPPSLDDVAARLASIDWSLGAPPAIDLSAFYHPETLRRLCALRAHLQRETLDAVDDWIRMVALNRLTGHSPGFFSGRTMPPNQAVSAAAQAKMNAKSGMVPPPRDIAAIILKKSRALLKDGVPPPSRGARLLTADAAHVPQIATGSVSLVVTSPPFLDVVQYAQDNWLRCWFAGIKTATVPIAMHRTEAAWRGFVHDVLREQARILRPGGHLAFEVGEVRGGKILLEQSVWQAAENTGFERLGVLVNQQNFTKTANCWGVANNRAGTNSNRIVLLRRV